LNSARQSDSGANAGDADSQADEDSPPQEHDEDAVVEGSELNDDAKALKEELEKITVEAPSSPIMVEEFRAEEFPSSYRENSTKEKLVLAYAENFRRQYVHLYRDRKPLLLNPVNEVYTEKLVCTTLKPTQLPYEELYDWDGASEFVADYLNFIPLDPPYELPDRLLSPTTIIKRQKGNCFEYSTLLCSLLIGAGYDAYVVSGYANRETCLMDEAREICPMLKKKVQVKQETKTVEHKKYSVKPPKDLRSKFELMLAERERKAEEEAELKRRKEEEEQVAESEQPPPDTLHGLRIHSWVLVLEGKRDVPEGFFIEPFTGIAHPLSSDNYLGIESIWNHQNYWVNMQDCSEGVKKLRYDLGDCTLWEFMFMSNGKPTLQIPEDEDLIDGMDDEEEQEEVEKHLDMPPSWVTLINLPLKDFQMRCPHGKKVKYYKRAKLEKFAHYLMKDGLVCKLSIFEDKELTDIEQVREYFAHRADKLYERVFNHRTGLITEFLSPGRHRCLKEHKYKANAPSPENERSMIFYSEARVDGLMKRTEDPLQMTEEFTDREDHLYYRHVEFGTRPRKFGPAEDVTPRPILKMVEKYHRDKSKPANEDVAELLFLIAEEKITLTYHRVDDKISASTREFMKPPNSDEKGAMLVMSSDMHITFQVDHTEGQKKQVELYQMMVDLIKGEERCKEKIRESEKEVEEILDARTQEEATSRLEISVYDTMRNEKAKNHRKDLERLQLEEKLRKQEMELDYMAPFLAQLGTPEKLLRNQAIKLKEDCLADLKQRLIDKANLIQSRFEQETQELTKKQAWYQQNQVSMQKDDEEEYLNYCSEAMFRIHILEVRLNRHRDIAPHKYMELEQKLRSDGRLMEFCT